MDVIEIVDRERIVQAPKVSVLMITYNHEPFVAEALDSILVQDFEEGYEIVVSDDASTDSTLDILRDYQQRYPNQIRVLYAKENVGMNPNFVRTYRACRAEYIAMCEGDDYWCHDQKLAMQVDSLESRPGASMVFTDQVIYDGKEMQSRSYEHRDYMMNDVLLGFVAPIRCTMVRNIDAIPEFIETYSDYPSGDRMIAYCCALFGTLSHLPVITACYRQWGGGVWSSIPGEEWERVSTERLISFYGMADLTRDAKYMCPVSRTILVRLRRERGLFNKYRLLAYYANEMGISGLDLSRSVLGAFMRNQFRKVSQ